MFAGGGWYSEPTPLCQALVYVFSESTMNERQFAGIRLSTSTGSSNSSKLVNTRKLKADAALLLATFAVHSSREDCALYKALHDDS